MLELVRCPPVRGSALDALGGAVLAQRVRHLALEVLQDREQRAVGDHRPVQRVYGLGRAARAAEADAEAARLEVSRVRAGRHLAVTLLAREPRFDVVLLRGGGAEIARGDVCDAGRPPR